MKKAPLAIVLTILVGCASRPKRAETPAAQAPPAQAAPSRPSSYPPRQPGYEAEDAAKDTRAIAPAPPPAAAVESGAPSAGYATPPNRAAALSLASNEIESSQRELDVAAGDCKNACRALGSMDRAAGRLCGLAQSIDEQRRCGEAKNHVYSARDKVRNTCGFCPDVTVERGAPIPSR